LFFLILNSFFLSLSLLLPLKRNICLRCFFLFIGFLTLNNTLAPIAASIGWILSSLIILSGLIILSSLCRRNYYEIKRPHISSFIDTTKLLIQNLLDAPPVKHSPCHQWSFGPSMVCSGLTRKLPTVSQPDQIFWK
ncbi:hypothetical protein HID58_086821, partial [Brassica napus]